MEKDFEDLGDYPVCVKFDSDEDAINAIELLKSYSGTRGGLYFVPKSMIPRFREAGIHFKMGKELVAELAKSNAAA